MGEDGGQEDERRGTQLQRLCLPHGHQHQIGALVFFHMAYPVQQHNSHASYRSQPDYPGVFPPQFGGPIDAEVERGRHRSRQQPDPAGIQQPF